MKLQQALDGPGVAEGAAVVTGGNVGAGVGAVMITRNDPTLFGDLEQAPMTLVNVAPTAAA
jgi:hypothetical protein